MDLFEVLIVLAFIGLPLLEGVLKQRRKGGTGAPEGELPRRMPDDGPRRADTPERAPTPKRSPPIEEEAAADMIPADLWEVLTGERRQPQPVPEPEPEEWVLAEDQAWTDAGSLERETSWEPSGWEVEETEITEAESLERFREEQRELDEVGKVVSLEVLPPPPDVRHRLFHEKYDSTEVPTNTPARGLPHGLEGALKGPDLRRAVLLAEILGPPKGLG